MAQKVAFFAPAMAVVAGAGQRAAAHRSLAAHQGPLWKNGPFFEFSLCLSRACLGKMFVCICKWLKKNVLTHLSPSAPPTPHSLCRAALLQKTRGKHNRCLYVCPCLCPCVFYVCARSCLQRCSDARTHAPISHVIPIISVRAGCSRRTSSSASLSE